MGDYNQDKGYFPPQPQYGGPPQHGQPQYNPYPQPPAQGYYPDAGQAAHYQGGGTPYTPPPQGYYPPQQQQPQTVVVQQPAKKNDGLCLGCAVGACLCCCFDICC
ncbi:hypothetical protein K7432_006211 [Basidiobolus ranarum]|uniref:Cysteine-rich transmembrane CYSTM domain-containing protein n=1 Tax=Basidiobolus ranarum TaxID=34480 RepID=A0ABR2WVC6_9FUNG